MTTPTTDFVTSFDGTRLAVHTMGKGPVVLFLHGLFSSAEMNWIRFGHAQRLAEAGFKAVMPDLRAHGDSEKPADPAAYPPDVLGRDALAVIDALELTQFDLVGFSLGARTAMRAMIGGARPRRAVLGGMGLEGLAGWTDRAAFFIDAIDRFHEIKRGDPAFFTVQFMKTMKIDLPAARLLLHSVADTSPDEIAGIRVPTAIVCGAQDTDNGSAQKLAETMIDARYVEVPGTHMSSVTEPKFGEAITAFLSAQE